jgi:hypothetical protein
VFVDATSQRMRHHQGDLLFMLGASSIAAGAIGLFATLLYPLIAFSLFSLGLGLPAYFKATGDLRKMRNNLVDPAGEPQTQLGRTCGLIGSIVGVVGLVVGFIVFLFKAEVRWWFS